VPDGSSPERRTDYAARLAELGRIRAAPSTVLSVYLNTGWADEHQRERVRVFLKNEIRKARRRPSAQVIADDLDWIQAQGESLIEQARFPGARGVALFACRGLGLRETLPVRVPFEDAFVVADAPFLRPLAAALEAIPSILLVFVDGTSARLVPLNPEGPGAAVALESEVPGHHRRGGWAQLAQSRYQRHIQDHRGRHFEAVAEALVALAEGNSVQRIVMAGEPRTIAAFRRHLPRRVAERIAGTVPGGRYEAVSAILERAAAFIAELGGEEIGAAVDAVLTEAAKGGHAVAGISASLEAASRGSVHCLYVLRAFAEPGRMCVVCGILEPGQASSCSRCGNEARPVELGEALVDRVLATGGKVETVSAHRGLASAGGVAARLPYPL